MMAGRRRYSSMILLRPIFSRFTRSSFPFLSPSDACHVGYFGGGGRWRGRVRGGEKCLQTSVETALCFGCQHHIKAVAAMPLVFVIYFQMLTDNYLNLRRNPPDVGVTSGQKPSTKIIYIALQTSVGLF